MSCTIDEAYMNHYLEKAKSEHKMARSTFTALKPLFVKSIAETTIRGCKCKYCQNFGLLRDTLIGIGFKGIPKNHSCSIEISWCLFSKPTDAHDESTSNSEMHTCSQIHESWNSDEQLPGKNCILRQCSACGVEKYCKSMKEQNKQLLQKNGCVQWTQWQLKKVFNGKKNVKRMLPTLVEGTYQQLLKQYIKQLKAISLHQFMKIWQLKNFNMTLRNLQRGQLLLVHDFSQNLLLYTQDEVPGVHWDHEQATIHPTVAFYIGICRSLIKEEIIHLTNDR